MLTDLGLDGEGPCPAQSILNDHNGYGQTALTMAVRVVLVVAVAAVFPGFVSCDG